MLTLIELASKDSVPGSFGQNDTIDPSALIKLQDHELRVPLKVGDAESVAGAGFEEDGGQHIMQVRRWSSYLELIL